MHIAVVKSNCNELAHEEVHMLEPLLPAWSKERTPSVEDKADSPSYGDVCVKPLLK